MHTTIFAVVATLAAVAATEMVQRESRPAVRMASTTTAYTRVPPRLTVPSVTLVRIPAIVNA